jgi:hypothetical protein
MIRGTSRGSLRIAQRVEREATAADEFGALVAPVVDVERAYVEAGIPMVGGTA